MYALMVVPSDFPNGDAGAVRDLAFAKIYQELGYQVVLIGMGKNASDGTIDGIRFFSLYHNKDSIFQHIIQYVLYKKRLAALVCEITQNAGTPGLVHINDICGGAINWLIGFCNDNSVPILHDSTEWYSESEFKYGKWDKAYILKDRLNRKIIRNPIKVICISSYLEDHFKSRGLRTIRVPVIMDVKNASKSLRHPDDDGIVRLIYAGSPAAKDYLGEIIGAITGLPSSKQARLSAHILGIDEDTLMKICHVKEIPECVKVYGRVPRRQVIEVMRVMDFSLLMRPSGERYAMAGFPTKSVEAMSHRVAMICNLTSDLGMYLKDGENAVIADDCTADSFREAINRVLAMDRDEIENIKDRARLLAEDSFDYRIFSNCIKQFIEK